MEFEIARNESHVTVSVKGMLNAETAPELGDALLPRLERADNLVFDFAELDYISSAGLRVLMAAYKRLMKQGSVQIAHPGESVMEVLDMSGFSDLLEIV